MEDKKVTIQFSFTSVLWVLGIVGGIWLMFELKDILVPLLLAFILSMAISPLIDYLQGKKIPRAASISAFYILLFSTLYLIFRIVIPPFIHQIGSLFENRNAYINSLSSLFGPYAGSFKELANSSLTRLASSASNVNVDGLYNGARGVLGVLVDAILVFVVSFYLLLSKNGIEKTISSYVPKQHQKQTIGIYRKISKKMSHWLGGQVVLGFIIFIFAWIGLSILHVNYALTLAILAGVLEIVPLIGPWIAGTLAVVVSVTQSPVLALLVAAFFVIMQQLENHIIVPQVMKKSLGLNPIAVIMAILIGGKLLGVIGILISVPVASALAILLEEFIKIKEAEGVKNGN